MKITISQNVINILKEHLTDWQDLTGAEDELTPEMVKSLIEKMIFENGEQENLFEEYGDE